MNRESKRPLHFGVGFVYAPAPDLSAGQVLQFQQRLAQPERGIVFQQTQHQPPALTLNRTNPPLTVLMSPALVQGQLPAVAGVSQLTIFSTPPAGLANSFWEEAEDVLEVYREVWPAPAQLLMKHCVVRFLFEVEGHAFQYLWEQRLHQQTEALKAFGRPILGGGLRFVMPAPDGSQQPLLEVKVESFLSNPKQLFVEVDAKWSNTPSNELDPRQMLTETTEYVDGPVLDFLQSENGND